MIENTTNVQIHLFYPLLFLTIIILAGLITFYLFKCKDTKISFKHSDEHIEVHKDTTEKIKDIVTWTPEKEQELHSIETKLHDMEVMLIDMNTKLDTLTTRLLFLEKSKRA